MGTVMCIFLGLETYSTLAVFNFGFPFLFPRNILVPLANIIFYLHIVRDFAACCC